MLAHPKHISDQNILSMIAERNTEGWAHLYDKYAPAMFGIVCNFTNDKTLSEEIFKAAFLQLKNELLLLKNTCSLRICLLRHTNVFTRQELTSKKINYAINLKDDNSFVSIFSRENINIKELCTRFNLTAEEIKIKLRFELCALRSKNKQGA